MKDAILLLLSGLLASAFAWAFWHYLGLEGMAALQSIALCGSILDNVHLRRRIRQLESTQ